MNTEQNIKNTKSLAVGSFGIGTLILGAFLVSRFFQNYGFFTWIDVAYVGFLFVILCVFLNASYMLILVLNFILFRERRKEVFLTMIILLLNIPVVILYIYIVLEIDF